MATNLIEHCWLSYYAYIDSPFNATALLLVISQTAFLAARQVESSAISVVRPDGQKQARSLSPLIHLYLQAEHVLILSLFAAWPLATNFFNFALLTPVPAPVELILQTCLLLIIEEVFRTWVYGTSAKWIPGHSKREQDDAATTLAAEYMVPKATICLCMLVIGAGSSLGVPMHTLHFAPIVLWTGLRQIFCIRETRVVLNIAEEEPPKSDAADEEEFERAPSMKLE